MADADRLRAAYKTSLKRDATDEEIEGWTSGRFGGGNVNDWERQIAGSHEARQRAPLANQANTGAGYRPQEPPRDTFDSFVSANRNNENRQDVLKNAYRQWTGREADEAGLRAHQANPYGEEGALRTIYDSDESKAYAAVNPDAWAGRPSIDPAVDPNAPALYDPAAVEASIYTGYTPKYAMEGFAYDREQNTGKSAKDAFAFLSNNAPPPPINDKKALGDWFQKNVAPGMNALGHKIISVDGDKFTFENWQGRFTVDFGRGAGAEGGALAWQVDPDTAVMANGPYVPQQPRTPAGPAVPPVTTPPATTPPAVDPNAPVLPPVDPNAPPVVPDPTNQALANSTQYRRRRPYRRHNYQSGVPTAQPSI